MNHHSFTSYHLVIVRAKNLCLGESRFLRHDPQVVVKQTDKVPEAKCPFNFDAFFVTLIQLLWPRAVLQYNWSLWLTRSQITYKAWFLITWILPALLRWMYSAKMDVKPSWTTSFVIWWKLTFGVLGPSSWYVHHYYDARRCEIFRPGVNFWKIASFVDRQLSFIPQSFINP